MAEASVPVNLFNPGQVFACMGFLEAAYILLGDAEGGFDWSNEVDVRFRLCAEGDDNPFGVVLGFLSEAEITRCAPVGYTEPPKNEKQKRAAQDGADEDVAVDASLFPSETFPGPEADRMALPIRLEAGRRPCIDFGHWADRSGRDDFKLYAGNRSAAGIARAMLSGTREKPKKGQGEGDVRTHGLNALWTEQRSRLTDDPFGVVTPVGGTFNFDARKSWTPLDAGYSPDQQGHGVEASPVVEILAAIGLEHARPDEYQTRKVRYGAWSGLAPPILARVALGCARFGSPVRVFRFELELSGKNKVVTFAQEEANT
jgi:CRISPR-associated protein Csx14